VLGQKVHDVVRSEFSTAQRSEALNSLTETGNYHTEVVHYRRDGKPLWVEGDAMVLRNEAGRITGYVTVCRDITKRKRTEEELRRSEAHLAEEQRISHVGSWIWNVATGDCFWSEEHFRIFGLDPKTFKPTVENTQRLIHPEDLPLVERMLEQAVRARSNFEVDYRIIRPDDGTIRYHHGLGGPLAKEHGELEFIGMVVDVTERTRAEQARQQLLQQLVNAQEEERRRISRELHDSLGQHLTALHLGLKSIQTQDGCPISVADEIQQMRELALQIDAEVERLSFELRPPALDDLGLADALRRHIQQWSATSGIVVDLHLRGLDHERLPSFVETTLYRIVQEALTNVVKHAGVARVSLIIERRRAEVIAIIEDNGRGFDLEAAEAAPRRLGLKSMAERAALAGGRLDIETEPGSGTTIYVHIPLQTNQREEVE
jgi:PAS domain S-box-containing protein